MSIFRYNAFILDPENRLFNQNGQIQIWYVGCVCDNLSIDIQLANSEIITYISNADTSRRYFESRCTRPDDWREADHRLLVRCFIMIKDVGHRCSMFRKNKIFLIIRNQKVKAVFEQLLKNDKFKCRHILVPDMIAPGYVAITQP